jgi:hypothetical protein
MKSNNGIRKRVRDWMCGFQFRIWNQFWIWNYPFTNNKLKLMQIFKRKNWNLTKTNHDEGRKPSKSHDQLLNSMD